MSLFTNQGIDEMRAKRYTINGLERRIMQDMAFAQLELSRYVLRPADAKIAKARRGRLINALKRALSAAEALESA